jgi:hypothetical protein
MDENMKSQNKDRAVKALESLIEGYKGEIK